ncbi:hypothetical protein C8Q70DRAFT_114429 [Cubamyces menziesii]|nr:hypothetical protein C8Q70DRAFT_114429 [Cubamyces menziesii]
MGVLGVCAPCVPAGHIPSLLVMAHVKEHNAGDCTRRIGADASWSLLPMVPAVSWVGPCAIARTRLRWVCRRFHGFVPIKIIHRPYCVLRVEHPEATHAEETSASAFEVVWYDERERIHASAATHGEPRGRDAAQRRPRQHRPDGSLTAIPGACEHAASVQQVFGGCAPTFFSPLSR